MFVVDTNILLYAADRDSPEHAPCRMRLDSWRRQSSPWHLTWGIVYEFLRVITHPNVFRNPLTMAEAWSFIEALLASPGLSILAGTEHHQRVASEFFKEIPDLRGNIVFDAHTAILMKEHGILAMGRDLKHAYYIADLTEDTAKIAYIEATIPTQTPYIEKGL